MRGKIVAVAVRARLLIMETLPHRAKIGTVRLDSAGFAAAEDGGVGAGKNKAVTNQWKALIPGISEWSIERRGTKHV